MPIFSPSLSFRLVKVMSVGKIEATQKLSKRELAVNFLPQIKHFLYIRDGMMAKEPLFRFSFHFIFIMCQMQCWKCTHTSPFWMLRKTNKMRARERDRDSVPWFTIIIIISNIVIIVVVIVVKCLCALRTNKTAKRFCYSKIIVLPRNKHLVICLENKDSREMRSWRKKQSNATTVEKLLLFLIFRREQKSF